VVKHETFSRVQRVHKRRGASYIYTKSRDTQTRSRIQETGRPKPAQARAKAEGQALRFPRGSRPALVGLRFLSHLAGKFGIGQALASDLGDRQSEALRVVHILASVISECLFVYIAEEMERFNRDIGTVQATLQEAPEVLHRIGVNVSIRILNGVVDNGVLIVRLQSIIRLQLVGEDRRASPTCSSTCF